MKPVAHWDTVCISHRGKGLGESRDIPKGLCFGLLTCSMWAESSGLNQQPWLLAAQEHFAELMGRGRTRQETGAGGGGRDRGKTYPNNAFEGFCTPSHQVCVILVVFHQTGTVTPSKTSATVNNYAPISFYSNTPFFPLPLK